MQARDLLLYNTTDKKVNVSVYFQHGTFWLTQKAMAELFGVNVPAVNKPPVPAKVLRLLCVQALSWVWMGSSLSTAVRGLMPKSPSMCILWEQC